MSTMTLSSAFVPLASKMTTSPSLFMTSTTTTESSTSENISSSKEEEEESKDEKSQKKVAVLICPAQFCVPADYETFLSTLQSTINSNTSDESTTTIGTCRVANLPRTEWIKVAQSLPTRNFIESTLPVYKTLDWYFEAMEDALADIYKEEGDDVNVCIVGHSIGGWVARAYLGGLSGSSTAVNRLTQRQTTSFITLGTPHSSPSSALVDQTRGLLNEVTASPTCSSTSLTARGIDITCVCSTGLTSNVLSTNLEEIVAATSYVPLIGKGFIKNQNVKGDGIIPEDIAFMDQPARQIKIDSCSKTGMPVRHAHVLPTPWNLWDGYAPSIELSKDTFVWYGSEGVIGQWCDYVR